MRAGSVGLIANNDLEKCLRIAQDQGVITHRDPRCLAGAVAIAGAVFICLKSKKIDQSSFLSHLYNWTNPISSIMSFGIKQLNEKIDLNPDIAYQEIKKIGVEPGFEDGWFGISPFVISSVLWSLYSFLRHPDNYIDAIKAAISVGGDVDTTAAMTGSISGAYLGLEAIPYAIAKHLNDNKTWTYNQLVELATQCYDIVKGH